MLKSLCRSIQYHQAGVGVGVGLDLGGWNGALVGDFALDWFLHFGAILGLLCKLLYFIFEFGLDWKKFDACELFFMFWGVGVGVDESDVFVLAGEGVGGAV